MPALGFDACKLQFYSSNLNIISQRKQISCLRGIQSINHHLTPSCKRKCHLVHVNATSSPDAARFVHCAAFSGHRLCKQRSLCFTLCQNTPSYHSIWVVTFLNSIHSRQKVKNSCKTIYLITAGVSGVVGKCWTATGHAEGSGVLYWDWHNHSIRIAQTASTQVEKVSLTQMLLLSSARCTHPVPIPATEQVKLQS